MGPPAISERLLICGKVLAEIKPFVEVFSVISDIQMKGVARCDWISGGENITRECPTIDAVSDTVGSECHGSQGGTLWVPGTTKHSFRHTEWPRYRIVGLTHKALVGLKFKTRMSYCESDNNTDDK